MVVVNCTNLCKFFINRKLPHTLTKTLTTRPHSWSSKKIVQDLKFPIPPDKLGVQYPDLTINEGTIVRPKEAINPPSVSWSPKDGPSLYALSLIDLDAPSRSKPIYREWIHWLVVNITDNDVEKGETLAEYIGPGPPQGTDLHRYIVLLFVYNKRINFDQKRLPNNAFEGRRNFSSKKFTDKYNLGNPIAGNFFQAEFDDSVPALHRRIGIIK